MSNPFFQFKQFTVQHDRCAMKVGTDGVLLGAWAELGESKSVLDIGTGSGLLALMAAQRSSEAHIDAIDIDEAAVIQARENVLASPWNGHIDVFHCSLNNYTLNCIKRYDAILSNPPYFEQSLPSPNHKRTLARHNQTLTSFSLLENSLRLLSENGTLHLILPVKEGETFIQQAEKQSLFCTRKTSVHPRIDTPAKRLLLSFKQQFTPCLEDSLTIETTARHQFSKEYIELTSAYYLNF
jgi:tRNA1Val (adenine37-N6)-methyltransferase